MFRKAVRWTVATFDLDVFVVLRTAPVPVDDDVDRSEAGKSKLLLMILRYINAAMERAHYEIIEDAEPFYGSISGIQGVWATGVTLEACRKELADSLEDWLLFSVRQRADIPPVGDVKLEIPHEVA